MKRSIGALSALVAGVLCIAAVPAGASVTANGATVPARALTMRVADSTPTGPGGVSVSLDPGATATKRVVIGNHSADLRLTIRLESVAGASGGQASWVTLSDVVETLEPGANAAVTARILVPSNAVPGTATVNVVARVERAVQAADGSPVGGAPSVSLPITMNVKGAPTAQVSVVSVQNVSEQGRDFLAIEFQNVGATAIAMRGRARVATTPPETYAVTAQVAPLTNTVVRVGWVKPPGSKGVNVSVDASSSGGDQATWTGTVGAAPPTTVANAHTHATTARKSIFEQKRDPFLLGVLGAVTLAVLWFVYEMVRSLVRRRKRRRLLKQVGLIAARSEPSTAITTAPVPVPVAANPDHMNAIAAQLGALVGAIEHLTARLDSVNALPAPANALAPAVAVDVEPEPVASVPSGLRGTPIPAPPPPPSSMRSSTPAPAPAPEPVAPPAPAPVEVTSSLHDGYPYDWPTPEQLDRFAARRKAVANQTLFGDAE